jgi:hypothetical protein
MAARKRATSWVEDIPPEIAASVDGFLVRDLAQQARDIDQQLHEVVYVARQVHGVSWEKIAAALGVTKSAAWQRFGRDDPESGNWVRWADRWVPDDAAMLDGLAEAEPAVRAREARRLLV